MPDKLYQVGRIQVRTKGLWVSALYVHPDIPEGVHLCAIALAAIQPPYKHRFEEFKVLAKALAADIITEATGQQPQFVEEGKQGPIHEEEVRHASFFRKRKD